MASHQNVQQPSLTSRLFVCYVTFMLLLLLAQLSTQTSISNNQFQTVRKLNPLRYYKDAQFFRYQIPPQISTAIFRLNASQSDEPINSTLISSSWATLPSSIPASPTPPVNISTATPSSQLFNTTLLTVYTKKVVKFYRSLLSTSCKKPLDVTIYLRWGSLPLVSTKNASKPNNFIFDDQTNQYRIDLKTNGQIVVFNLTNPLPGDWYAIAYINQINDKISQKGLERECFYRLISSLSLEPLNLTTEVPVLASTAQPLKQSLVVDQSDNQHELFYKFYLTTKEYGAKIVIKNCHFKASTNLRHNSSPSSPLMYVPHQSNNNEQVQNNMNQTLNGSCPIQVNYRSLALPSSTNRDFFFDCGSNHSNNNVEISNGKCIIDLPTYSPNEWNYIQIVPLFGHNDSNMMSETRTKIIYGSINFTIQILVGQEAFLYNYFNDQHCHSQSHSVSTMSSTGATSSTTYSPLHPYGKNFGIRNEGNQMYNSYITTAASSVVAPPKPNSVSLNNDLQANNINSGLDIEEFEMNSNAHSSSQNNKMTHKKDDLITQRPVIHNNGDVNSLDYDEEEAMDEEESKPSDNLVNQFNKRSADQPSGNKDRKKSDRRKEERRLKKLKNKNRQKNRDSQKVASLSIQDQCQFDPSKILSTLDEDDLTNMTSFNIVNLTRYQTTDNFEFKYSHLDANNFVNSHNISSFIDIDNEKPSLANFTIIPQFDIGGSLIVDLAISPRTNYSQQNVSVTLCLTHNRLPTVFPSTSGMRFSEFCYGHLISNTSNSNFSSHGSTIQSLVVPYPQPGTWFVSLVVRCYTDEDLADDPNLMSNVDYGSSCDYSNQTSVLIDIRSTACYNSRCLNGGKCLQYLNGGILYSTCSCKAGWKGWVCNDGSEALSDEKLLMNFLLLTLSNTAFIPAIVVAACRRYFTESAIYLITMVSSALYHACESAYSQSYCVLNLGLLQFADFYAAVLSFFVTLITLANLPKGCKSFLHLLGAILIALITQNDRTSLWTFVVPAGFGMLLLVICWCTHCCRKSCYPPTKCWAFSVCPAFVLTVIGLIIYAFFETQENYAITHSIWHGIVALALLFAIPSMPSTNTIENEEEDDERVHFMSSSSSSGAGSGKGIQNAKLAHVEWRPPHTSFKFLHDDIDML